MEMNPDKTFDNAICFFLDVGQGTSQVVLFGEQKDRAIVVDTGRKRAQAESPVICLLKKYAVKTIEVLILSHNDSDHIGDAVNIIDAYKERIKSVYFIKDRSASQNNLEKILKSAVEEDLIEEDNLHLLIADELNRDIVPEGQQMCFTVLYPDALANLGNDGNDTCAIIALTVGSQKVIFSGDAPIAAWRNIVRKNQKIEVKILTVPHHGGYFVSKNNQTEELQEFHASLVKTDYAIASFATCNSHDHPLSEVIQSFAKHSEVFCMQKSKQCGGVDNNTACCGTIIAEIGQYSTEIFNVDLLKKRKEAEPSRLCMTSSNR